MVMTRQKFK